MALFRNENGEVVPYYAGEPRTPRNRRNVPNGGPVNVPQRNRPANAAQRRRRTRRSNGTNRRPAYERQAAAMPQVRVLLQNLSRHEIDNMVDNIQRQEAIRRIDLSSLNCKFFH